MEKNTLFVTTKLWTKKDLKSLQNKIHDQNYRWEAKILKDGKKLFSYFYSKVDLEILAIQEGFTILSVKKL